MSTWHLCPHWDMCVPKFVCKKPRLEPLKQPTYGYKPSLLDHFISRVSTWLDYKWDHFSSKVHGCTKQKWQENTWPLKVHLTDVRRSKILSSKLADSLTQLGVFFYWRCPWVNIFFTFDEEKVIYSLKVFDFAIDH